MRLASHAAGYAAVLVLMSAGAAQSLAGTDTVFTDDIVAGAVTTSDIRQNAVTGSRVLDGSLTGADLASGSVGLSRLGGTWTAPVQQTVGINAAGFAFAPCPAGKTAISGASDAASTSANVIASIPQGDGWLVSYRNWDQNNTVLIDVRALCVRK